MNVNGRLKLLLLINFICLSLFCKAQFADLIIQKTGPSSVRTGSPMSYTIKVSNNGPVDVTNASFTDTFPEGASNVLLRNCNASGGAQCFDSSNYSINVSFVHPPIPTYIFTGTIPFLPVNGEVTFVIDLSSPDSTQLSSFSNTATILPPAGINDPDLTTNSSTWNTVIIKDNIDISVLNSVDDDNGFDCSNFPKSYNYIVQWINHGPLDVFNVNIYDNLYAADIIANGTSHFIYPWKISNILWTSSPGTTTPSEPIPSTGRLDLYYSNPGPFFINSTNQFVPVFEKNDTIIFSYTLTFDTSIITGCSGDIAWNMGNSAGFDPYNLRNVTDTFPLNDTATVMSSRMSCINSTNNGNNVDINVIKTVDDIKGYSMDSLPRSYHYTVQWINSGPADVNNLSAIDVMTAINEVVQDQGNATYNYTWNISDVLWKASPGSFSPGSTLPSSGNFTIQHNPILNPQSNLISSTSTLIPILETGDTLTLTYTFTLNKPTITGCGRVNLSWDLNNSSKFEIPSCFYDTVPDNNVSSVISGPMTATSDPCYKTDIEVIKTVDDKQDYVCEDLPLDLHYTVCWINHGPASADGILISDNLSAYNSTASGNGNASYLYQWNISNVLWTSGSGATTPVDTFDMTHGNLVLPDSGFSAQLYSTLSSFTPGDTISLSYTLHVESPTVQGCGRNVLWDINSYSDFIIPNNLLVDTIPQNNNSLISTGTFEASATDLVISGTVNPAIVNSGDTLSVTIEFYNASQSSTSPASWIDTLPGTFNIDLNSIECTAVNGFPSCGIISYDTSTRILRQEINSMPANSGLKVTFKGTVSALQTLTEFNKAYAVHPCLDCVPATNFTQSNYQINGQCDSVFAGMDGDTLIDLSSTDTLFLFQLLRGSPMSGGTWSRIIGTGGTFNAVEEIFVPAPGSTNSIFMYVLDGNAPCPSDTSYVTIQFNVCDSVFAGMDGDTLIDLGSTDTLFLFQLLRGHPMSGGTWSRIIGTGGTFNAVEEIFIPAPGSINNIFMYVLDGNAPCPSDTSYVTIQFNYIIVDPVIFIDSMQVRTTISICSPFWATGTISSCDSLKHGSSNLGSWLIDSIPECFVYTSIRKGDDTICILVCDTSMQTCIQTSVILTITGIPPLAMDDHAEIKYNTPVIIPVLTNDTATDSDPLLLCQPAVIDLPKNGSFTVNQDGTITYTPFNAYQGVDSFRYTICDPDGSDSAWVFINVAGVCDIPDAFSPNNDGVNDYFLIRCAGGQIEFSVYNRWGIEVYRNANYQNDWDGKYKGNLLPDGTYFYSAKFNNLKGEPIHKAGFITLHR